MGMSDARPPPSPPLCVIILYLRGIQLNSSTLADVFHESEARNISWKRVGVRRRRAAVLK